MSSPTATATATATAAAAAAMRSAFVDRDFAPVADLLADGVVFHSPVLERPWTTSGVVARLGPAMVSVFDDVELAPDVLDGSRAILSFRGRVGAVAGQAMQTLDVDGDGRIAELAIFIRPLPALIAVAKAMQARVDPGLLAEHVR